MFLHYLPESEARAAGPETAKLCRSILSRYSFPLRTASQFFLTALPSFKGRHCASNPKCPASKMVYVYHPGRSRMEVSACKRPRSPRKCEPANLVARCADRFDPVRRCIQRDRHGICSASVTSTTKPSCGPRLSSADPLPGSGRGPSAVVSPKRGNWAGPPLSASG